MVSECEIVHTLTRSYTRTYAHAQSYECLPVSVLRSTSGADMVKRVREGNFLWTQSLVLAGCAGLFTKLMRAGLVEAILGHYAYPDSVEQDTLPAGHDLWRCRVQPLALLQNAVAFMAEEDEMDESELNKRRIEVATRLAPLIKVMADPRRMLFGFHYEWSHGASYFAALVGNTILERGGGEKVRALFHREDLVLLLEMLSVAPINEVRAKVPVPKKTDVNRRLTRKRDFGDDTARMRFRVPPPRLERDGDCILLLAEDGHNFLATRLLALAALVEILGHAKHRLGVATKDKGQFFLQVRMSRLQCNVRRVARESMCR